MGGTSGTDTTEMQNIFNILTLYSVLLPYYLPMQITIKLQQALQKKTTHMLFKQPQNV